jgi:hypothetical protein
VLKRRCSCFRRQLNELWSTGIYFPNFPICRKIKKVKITRQANLHCQKNHSNDSGCAPGVVLFYCVEHEVCIGYVVLSNVESPNVPFEILATRFKKMPEIVIYDNGCNLNEYILNRTPYLFRRTQILVDGFHFHSHTNCAPTFSTSENSYLSTNLNTSLFEQKNARLAKLKNTAPLMRSRVFMSLLRFAVSHLNYKKKMQLLDQKKQNVTTYH